MEEKVTVKLEAKAEMSDIDKLKMNIMSLKKQLSDAQYIMNRATSGAEFKQAAMEAIQYENAIKDANRQLKSMTQETNKVNKVSSMTFNSASKQITSTTKKISKYMLSLLSLRSIYSLLSRAASAYLGVDQELSNKLQSAWVGLGAVLSPVLEYLANLITKVVSYINAFVKALTGIDYVAKANKKALEGQTKATKQLQNATTGIDELNIVSQDSGAGGGASAAATTFKPEPIDTKSFDNWLTVLGAIVTILDTIRWILAGVLAGAVMGLKEIFIGVFKAVYDVLYGFWYGIITIVKGVIDGIKIMWKGLVDGIKDIIEGFKNGDWKKVWEGIKKIIVSSIKGAWTALKGIISGILNILQGIGTGVVNLFIGIINGVLQLINGVIRGLNQIKVPDWVPGLGGKGISIKEISTIQYVSFKPIKLATGGIVNDSVIANIGERGREAVVPLTNENAMQQLGDIIGGYVSNVGNNSQPTRQEFIVNLDRKVLATAVNKANYESGATLTKGAFAL